MSYVLTRTRLPTYATMVTSDRSPRLTRRDAWLLAQQHHRVLRPPQPARNACKRHLGQETARTGDRQDLDELGIGPQEGRDGGRSRRPHAAHRLDRELECELADRRVLPRHAQRPTLDDP